MIDRKIKIVEALEEKLKDVKKSSGYDYDLTVLDGVDWKTSDQLDSCLLPVAFVSVEGAETYAPDGNVPFDVIAEIPVYVIMRKDETPATNRAECRKMIRNIKTALKTVAIDYALKETDDVTNFYLTRIETDTGWSGNFVFIMFLFSASYSEEDLWVV